MRKKLFFIFVSILVITGGSFFIISFIRSQNNKDTYTSATRGYFEQTVEISGKVVPIRVAHLGFETSGTITRVNAEIGDTVLKGDILVELDDASVKSNLAKAEAELQSEITTLSDLSVGSDSTELNNTRKSIIATLQDAYVTTDNAIRNNTDQFFDNPQAANPDVSYAFGNLDARDNINDERVALQKNFNAWSVFLRTLSPASFSQENILQTKSYIYTTISFLDLLTDAINSDHAEKYLSDTDKALYKTDIATARSSVQSALSAVISSEELLQNVTAKIPLQENNVIRAQAEVESYKIALSKTTIIAPFDGIITQQEAQVGEITTAGKEIVSMISSEGLKLESYVPEVYISKVETGQSATLIFDAYGDDVIFSAHIVAIDPVETIRDGISTYKTTFYFDKTDTRIRSGMTADVSIITDKREDVLLIPRRAIITEDNSSFVYLRKENRDEKVQIVTGAFDSHGNVEILEGLSENNIILLNPER